MVVSPAEGVTLSGAVQYGVTVNGSTLWRILRFWQIPKVQQAYGWNLSGKRTENKRKVKKMWKEINKFLVTVDNLVWGVPLIILIMAGGLLLTTRIKLLQVRKLPLALKWMIKNEEGGEGEISSFSALCTALSATIGTGNIVGVATAVGAGGPGALFWMIVAAFLGMATKFSEGLLAVKYRVVAKDGHSLGGPFYYIEQGMGKRWKWLAKLFAFFGVCVGLFGIGTFSQVNGISSAVNNFFDPNNAHRVKSIPFLADYSWSVVIASLILTFCVAAVLIGGVKRIASVSQVIVPFMAVLYVGLAVIIIITNITAVPAALASIVKSAFTGSALAGGAVGSVFVAMQKGVARGIFSNEAGLGSAPIAAAAAQTKEPVRQGLVSMTGTFIDTIIICTLTGLSLTVTGVWCGDLNGAAMTDAAFRMAFPTWGGMLLLVGLVLFAFTTILGWNYYGERCVEYLLGVKAIMPYRVIFIILIACGPFLKLEEIWVLADIVNGLMAIPNLIGLIGLRKEIVAETEKYFEYEQPVELVTNIEG